MMDLPEHGKPPDADQNSRYEFQQHRLKPPPPAVANMMPPKVDPPPAVAQAQTGPPQLTAEQTAALTELASALLDKTPLDTGITIADALALIKSAQIVNTNPKVDQASKQRMVNAAYKLQVAIIKVRPSIEDALNMSWQYA